MTSRGGEKSWDEINNPRLKGHNYEDYEWENYGGGGVSEIEEELSSEVVFDHMNNNRRGVIEPLERIREGMSSVSSFDDLYGGRDDDEAVYVAVGRQSEETMGKLPISQVNPEQKENYMIQETAKRRQFLQKFLTLCSASQVKVDTILIESEMEAKAIVDLIPILNIKKLVLGTTKSDLRRMRSRRGNGVIDQILSNAPESCEVKIICEGNEMSELPLDSPSPSLSPRATDPAPVFAQKQPSSFPCGCFK
ncbi:hypothetical protein DH2020_017147 [Rehmannia glutinosa]|uniref:Uncharacterized protein n=1 Tax=Rehmannia glutinosa TaxID=99300 RepID=A0ABR0WTE3_REHGL